ncbi:hypothetical protein H257_09485 [Aphanomyces astaci]|uniref:Uncharacterized protein n=1 Tax=Aphanomyces astaci TaxID=112090 RepID=W4GBX9_APHAT|nr:hypothetical protein H257_09485 [Aphanomyces astaci]ETV76468.1 hypothetical protein H257_09485 [Aphanomyces astaci]|eukprot:XP_009834013.1 hypothetical protein H257_09485 [Aphanomyces astaci]
MGAGSSGGNAWPTRRVEHVAPKVRLVVGLLACRGSDFFGNGGQKVRQSLTSPVTYVHVKEGHGQQKVLVSFAGAGTQHTPVVKDTFCVGKGNVILVIAITMITQNRSGDFRAALFSTVSLHVGQPLELEFPRVRGPHLLKCAEESMLLLWITDVRRDGGIVALSLSSLTKSIAVALT